MGRGAGGLKGGEEDDHKRKRKQCDCGGNEDEEDMKLSQVGSE